ncbi:MAG: citramalate synthase [Acidimicrobiales bacterium]|jgi:2-isopropylmalate synthase|nr:citramalate synthase [Acidimicrobiia bacterium]
MPNPGGTPKAVDIYDTTLRDGAQLEGISFTVDDKLRIAEQLDRLGVHYIEGGWPGANPKDVEFFERAKTELNLKQSRLVAFGSTRRVNGEAKNDPTLANLVASGTQTVCIVGKSWDYHVTEALRTTLEEGVAMVADSIRYLKEQGLEVFFDAEHFFDGYRANPTFALDVLQGAVDAGADCLVICDTNGGTLPDEVERTVTEVVAKFSTPIGVHFHNDTGCAIANTMIGVKAGATQVQGTINGYGERVGNCDLIPVIANLSLKLGIETLPEGHLKEITSVAHHVAEVANFAADPQQPYAGSTAFAHKAGLHTSAIARRPDAYEHIDPDLVGNGTRFLVSEMAGRATIALRAEQLGLNLETEVLGEVVETLKDLEYRGYHFEAADASLELLMRAAGGWEQEFFQLESFSVQVGHHSGSGSRAWNDVAVEVETEATVTITLDQQSVTATGSGNGPVNALDAALRSALGDRYSAIDTLRLTDFKVRVLETGRGTGAVTRVLLDTTNGEDTWTTIGVSENIIEASWQALADSMVYGLLKEENKL